MATEAEEGEIIDEAFWAKEDEADERKQQIWDNAKPCDWTTQTALPRIGWCRVGDVYWPPTAAPAAARKRPTDPDAKVKKKKKP